MKLCLFKEWDQWLREACYAYNSSVNSSTGFAAAELSFRRKLRVPLDILYGLSVSKNRFFSMKEFNEKLSKMFDVANERVNIRQVNSSTYYDKIIKDEKLQVETLVYIYLPRHGRKEITLKWDGPHKILSEKHPVYEIQVNGKSKWLG